MDTLAALGDHVDVELGLRSDAWDHKVELTCPGLAGLSRCTWVGGAISAIVVLIEDHCAVQVALECDKGDINWLIKDTLDVEFLVGASLDWVGVSVGSLLIENEVVEAADHFDDDLRVRVLFLLVRGELALLHLVALNQLRDDVLSGCDASQSGEGERLVHI